MAVAFRKIADIAKAASLRVKDSSSPLSRFFGQQQKPFVLTENELVTLQDSVASINCADLGVELQQFASEQQAKDRNAVSYIQVAENSDLLMAVFVLPPGSEIPMHDHPNMYVLSKVLWGELHVESFDPVEATWSKSHKERVAFRNGLSVTPANGTRMLTPTEGNIHAFRANTWTAVFDVAIPPYDQTKGRSCTYYAPLDLTKDHLYDFSNGAPEGLDDEFRERVFLQVWHTNFHYFEKRRIVYYRTSIAPNSFFFVLR